MEVLQKQNDRHRACHFSIVGGVPEGAGKLAGCDRDNSQHTTISHTVIELHRARSGSISRR
jgi:hypothetical protein